MGMPPSAPPPAGRDRRAALPVVVLVLACAGVAGLYWPSMANDTYVLDSRFEILGDPILEMHQFRLPAMKKIVTTGHAHGLRRGLPRLTHAIQVGLHGHRVALLRLGNIVLHLLIGVVVFLLCRETLLFPALAHLQRARRWAPTLTAVIWLVHPVQIQTVVYVMQRASIMSAGFSLLALLLYARMRRTAPRPGRRRTTFVVLCVTCWALALWCKMNAAVLPVVAYLYDWFLVRDLKRPSRREIVLVATLGAVGATAALVYAAWFFVPALGWEKQSVLEHCLTQTRVLWDYLALIFYAAPSQLNFDVYNQYSVSHSLLRPPTTALALLGLCALWAGAARCARRWRLLSLGMLLFFVALAMESSVLRLETYKESRLYLPVVFLLFGIIATFAETLRRPRLRLAVAVAAVAVLATWTHMRMRVWTHPILLHEDAYAKTPHNPRNLSELGRIYACHRRTEEALPLLKEAARSPLRRDFWEEDVAYTQRLIDAEKKLARDPRNPAAHAEIAEMLGIRGLQCIFTLGPNTAHYQRLVRSYLHASMVPAAREPNRRRNP